jgi:regulator of nonsense transcripts 2
LPCAFFSELGLWRCQESEGLGGSPFEDEETRSFYETLPDLRAVVPAILLGDKPEEKPEEAPRAPDSGQEAGPAESVAPSGGPEPQPASGRSAGERQPPPCLLGLGFDGGTRACGISALGRPGVPSVLDLRRAAGAAEAGRAPPEAPGEAPGELEAVLAGLPGCVNRAACDTLAANFCYLNSKGARRRLVRPPNESVYLRFHDSIHLALFVRVPSVQRHHNACTRCMRCAGWRLRIPCLAADACT